MTFRNVPLKSVQTSFGTLQDTIGINVRARDVPPSTLISRVFVLQSTLHEITMKKEYRAEQSSAA